MDARLHLKVNRYFSANEGHNSKMEKAVTSEIKLGLSFMVPDIVYKSNLAYLSWFLTLLITFKLFD